jgi:hypothetical protein
MRKKKFRYDEWICRLIDGLCWLIIGELLAMMSYMLNALLHMFCLFKYLHVVELIVIYKLIIGVSQPRAKW